MTVEIRPGIHRPDWSVVTKPGAREAMLGRDHSRSTLAEKWNQALEPAQDRVWRAVLERFARLGRPPGLHEISKETGLSAEDIRTLVSELQAHDLLGSDPSADVILYAYPFSGARTEHHVQLRGQGLHAVCAIDALGIAGMFRSDVVIEVFLPSLRRPDRNRHRTRREVFERCATRRCCRMVRPRLYRTSSGILLSCNRVLLLRRRAAPVVERTKPATRGLLPHARRGTGSGPSPV